MKTYPASRRALPQTYIPREVLKFVCPDSAQALMARMKEYGINIKRLARKADLSPRTILKMINGRISPIDAQGKWTIVALKISKALNTTPEVIFEEVQDRIHSELVKPSPRLFPRSLIAELYTPAPGPDIIEELYR